MFRRWRKAEFSDGEIDLIPVDEWPADEEMGFGEEFNWIIAPSGRHREMGRISLRLGESPCIYAYGHIGYHVDPPYRGHGFAGKACRLLVPLIRSRGKESVVITWDADNWGSRNIYESLGCELERTIQVPAWIRAHCSISRVKCRYIWHIGH